LKAKIAAAVIAGKWGRDGQIIVSVTPDCAFTRTWQQADMG